MEELGIHRSRVDSVVYQAGFFVEINSFPYSTCKCIGLRRAKTILNNKSGGLTLIARLSSKSNWDRVVLVLGEMNSSIAQNRGLRQTTVYLYGKEMNLASTSYHKQKLIWDGS